MNNSTKLLLALYLCILPQAIKPMSDGRIVEWGTDEECLRRHATNRLFRSCAPRVASMTPGRTGSYSIPRLTRKSYSPFHNPEAQRYLLTFSDKRREEQETEEFERRLIDLESASFFYHVQPTIAFMTPGRTASILDGYQTNTVKPICDSRQHMRVRKKKVARI